MGKIVKRHGSRMDSAHIIGIRRPARATNDDGSVSAPGACLIVYPAAGHDEKRALWRYVRRFGVYLTGIGEPLTTDSAKPDFAAYRAIGPVDALAGMLGRPFLRDATYDCPANVLGERLVMPSAGNGYVDQRRLPPVPREARRVVKPAVADVGERAAGGCVADRPITNPLDLTEKPETYNRRVMRQPGRAPREKPRRMDTPKNPADGLTPPEARSYVPPVDLTELPIRVRFALAGGAVLSAGPPIPRNPVRDELDRVWIGRALADD